MSIVARAIATAGGAGYAPIAPGTCGTAVAVPLAWLCRDMHVAVFAALTVAVIAIGTWAAAAADRYWGTHDNGRIVIDEVAGYFVTVLAIDRSSWILLAAGFLLFRAFDIAKPPPVRAIDKRLGGGLGVVLDDVAAGLYGLLLLWAVAHAGLHERVAGW